MCRVIDATTLLDSDATVSFADATVSFADATVSFADATISFAGATKSVNATVTLDLSTFRTIQEPCVGPVIIKEYR